MNKTKLEQEYHNFLITRSYTLNEELEEVVDERNRRLLFLTDYVLDLTTYCENYSIKIGEKVVDILKHIYCNSYQFSQDSNIKPLNYYVCYPYDLEYQFVVYVQFIIQYLNCETNIYKCWFDEKKEILGYKLTRENIKYLINWFDGEDMD